MGRDRRKHYGGFWRRVLAFGVDNLVLHLAAVLTLIFLAAVAPVAGWQDYTGDALAEIPSLTLRILASYFAMLTAMYFFYFIYFHGTTGQTLGKKIFGLKVIRAGGEPMTLGVSFLRWVGYIVSGFAAHLGFLWIIFDGKKQGWHDKIAHTYVVNIRKYNASRADIPYKNTLTNEGILYR